MPETKQAQPHTVLESYIVSRLANPLSKQPVAPSFFPLVNGVIDARVFLKNTHGFNEWVDGQDEYEKDMSSVCARQTVEQYLAEISYDRPVYERYRMSGAVLDVGGGTGTVREFLPETVQFVSIDPYINAPHEVPPSQREAYTCLVALPLSFIAATAEFLRFVAESFDWVHMRSMLDHVQVPDLALMEARRVLKSDGRVLIGIYVKGGKSGYVPLKQKLKDLIKHGLESVGIDRWKDHHIWHPSYKGLMELIEDNGFTAEDVYWQPHWHDQVCYACARKA